MLHGRTDGRTDGRARAGGRAPRINANACAGKPTAEFRSFRTTRLLLLMMITTTATTTTMPSPLPRSLSNRAWPGLHPLDIHGNTYAYAYWKIATHSS